jgi:hypothetical protein
VQPLLKTSQAAVRYLTAEPHLRDRPMRDLELICKTALKGHRPRPLYLPDEGDAHVDEVTHEWTSNEIEWIQLFIVKFFAPYLPVIDNQAVALSLEQAVALARKDKFRYIGWKCCQSMIDELRHRQRLSNTVDGMEDGEPAPVPPKFVSEHEVSVESEFANRSSLGTRSVELNEVFERHRASLAKLLGSKLFAVLEIQCAAMESKGDVREEVERRLKVKARQATTYIEKLKKVMAKAQADKNYAALELFAALMDAHKRVHQTASTATRAVDGNDEDRDDDILDDVLDGEDRTPSERLPAQLSRQSRRRV